MKTILIGQLKLKQTRLQNDKKSYWYQGQLNLPQNIYGDFLKRIKQCYLTFTYIASNKPIVNEEVILIGSLDEQYFGNRTTPWHSMTIETIVGKSSSILQTLGLTFEQVKEKIQNNDQDILEQICNANSDCLQKVIDLVGDSQLASTLYSYFKEDTIEEILKNPWELINIFPRYTIDRADYIANKLDIPMSDDRRFFALINLYVHDVCKSEGDTYVKEFMIQALYYKHFKDSMEYPTFIEKIESKDSSIIKSSLGYHPKHLFSMEYVASMFLKQVLRSSYKANSEEQEAILQIKEECPYTFTSEQEVALTYALSLPFYVITGGPGTGKTTILKAIIDKVKLAHRCSDKEILLVSPTAKAAARMLEQTGIKAQTLHSAFSILPQDTRSITNKALKNCLDRLQGIQHIIVDESSMLDSFVFGRFCEVLLAFEKCYNYMPNILFVGDSNQLPPVESGQPFQDIVHILEEKYPKKITRFNVVKRQSDKSNIPYFADCIQKGKLPTLKKLQTMNDIVFMKGDAYGLLDTLTDIVKNEEDKPQIITPYRNGAYADTVYAINQGVATLYNPKRTLSQYYCKGDRIVHKVNNPDTKTTNGSTGTIVDVVMFKSAIHDSYLVIEKESGETYKLPYTYWDTIELAYAITIHASQGSEYSCVIIPMTRNSNGNFLSKNLFYTAVTRAKNKVILLGDYDKFQKIAKQKAKNRDTMLAYWLEKESDNEHAL